MGWLFMPRSSMGGHDTPKAYLDAQFTYEHIREDGTVKALRVLASSCLRNQVYYAAVEPFTNGVAEPVFAIVCLVRWNPRSTSGEEFGYKDLDETMGPCEAECPARILALLGPTDSEYALDWRRRCHASLSRRARPIADGMRIRLDEPLTFTDGHEGTEFIVEKKGRSLRFLDPDSRRRYRIGRFAERNWIVVPETRVHRTLFG
jgi:hypothetical protein